MGKWKQEPQSLLPTATPSDMDIAFFAGFYEGEGSVTPSNRGTKNFSLKVSQKDPEMLYRMRDLWGGSIKFWATRNKKASPTFEGYESWKNPIYQWVVCGDRGRRFLKDIYPYMSSRRKTQIDKIDLTFTGRLARKSPIMSPERQARRAQMDAHEKYLESKAHHRAENLERSRTLDREYKQKKFGHTPRKAIETLTVQ